MTRDTPLRVGVVTCERAPDLTDDGQALVTALGEHGLAAEPLVWTDERIDWSALDAALVRSCWDYHTRIESFRDWLSVLVDAGVAVCNPPEVVRWNVHKFYLRDLAAAGVPAVPTAWVEHDADADLRAILRERGWQDAVVKPAVGTSAAGVWRTSLADAADHRDRFTDVLDRGDALVQQFVPEIEDGERELVFFEGRFSHAFRSVPDADDFRTHPDFGGTTEPLDPAPEVVEQAADALQITCAVVGVEPADLPYARVDGVVRDDTFLLVELELVEPYLHLDVSPNAPTRFADAVGDYVRRHATD